MVVVKKLVWDEWNIAHIARHDVTPDEVEDVCKERLVYQKEMEENDKEKKHNS